MNLDICDRTAIRRTEVRCCSLARCRQCWRLGELLLTDDFLAWRDSSSRGWKPSEECFVIPLEQVKAARVSCSRLGLRKRIHFSLEGTSIRRHCTTYQVDLI